MKELLAEIGLRAMKVVAAALVGLLVYALMTGVFGATGSPQLALEAFIAGAVIVLLFESSPI
ncbi:MAG TPA: hypothetical protein VK831_04535 [Candidatus Deferrimicrobiaceae bacterium]|nr:hypothetical protein [Candidatus Deferrimicrobiaceae bacterium]